MGLTLAFSTRARGHHLGAYIRQLKQSSGLAKVEVLIQVNPGLQSLSQVYNHFLEQASFPVVCLIHDDVSFVRNSLWGRQILRAFQRDPNVAVLSAAGSISLERHGVYWLPQEEMLGAVRHQLFSQRIDSEYSQAPASTLPALVLDGLILAVHRERVSTHFDEHLQGFHFYDIGFSLAQSLAHQRGESGPCQVLPRLGIVHKSGGQPGPDFETARKCFVQWYDSVLPARLRPELLLKKPLAISAHTERVGCLILHYQEHQRHLKALVDYLSPDCVSIRLLNLSGRVLESFSVSEAIDCAEIAAQCQDAVLLSLRPWLTSLDYLFLLDSRVQPLQSWIPALVRRFRQFPKLGVLGLRLHYPDSHLLHHNGMQMFAYQGQYDVFYRGIHSPYAYRNAFERDCLGAPATALMLRSQDFLSWGGLGQQTWIPGLELNLRALKAGYFNAVDSSLVGYWHDAHEQQHQDHPLFLNYLQKWMSQWGQDPNIQARVQRF